VDIWRSIENSRLQPRFADGFSQESVTSVIGSPAEAGSQIQSMPEYHRLKSVAKMGDVNDEDS